MRITAGPLSFIKIKELLWNNVLIICFSPFRIWHVAGPAGPGGGRLLHVSLLRRQLPLPGRRHRPLPQPDLLNLPGLMMATQNQKNWIRSTLSSWGHNAACTMCNGRQSQQQYTVYSRLRLTDLFLFLTDVKNMSTGVLTVQTKVQKWQEAELRANWLTWTAKEEIWSNYECK